ncbi:MAG: cyclophilin-like fold protein [Desulfobacterales bacterium]
MPDPAAGRSILLDFGKFRLEAVLFNTRIARSFKENLPYTVDLTGWGKELYGSIGLGLGEENPVDEVPEGAIAYTGRGNLVCVFFGQKPAWPVEYIGQIKEGQWQKLLENDEIRRLEIRPA